MHLLVLSRVYPWRALLFGYQVALPGEHAHIAMQHLFLVWLEFLLLLMLLVVGLDEGEFLLIRFFLDY